MKLKQKHNVIFIAIPMLLVISGCALMSPVKSDEPTTYIIDSASTQRMSRMPSEQTLLVTNTKAAAGYGDTSMFYSKASHKLRPFTKNEWLAPPADMLLPVIVQSLRNSGTFRAVVWPPFSGETNLTLDTKLIELWQDFTRPVSRVRMTLQADLTNNKTDRIILSQRFTAVVPAPGNNPRAGVVAANQATQQIMRKLAVFLALRGARR